MESENPPDADADLIARVLTDDQTAAAALVQRYALHVRCICVRRTRREIEVDDAVQEVWRNVFQYIGRFKGTAPLKNWIGKIASNTCYSRLRKQDNREIFFDDLNDGAKILHGGNARANLGLEPQAHE